MAESKKKKPAKSVKPRKSKAALATATSAKATAKPKKRKKVAATKPARTSTRPKAATRRASSSTSSGFDITKLIDHPLVADLLAVGAMAAVAAIADHHVKTRTGETKSGSSKAVKAAGIAAASAIGKRLMTEVSEVKKAASAAKPKRGSA